MGEGNDYSRYLRNLLSIKKPKIRNEKEIRPRTVAVTHQYEHELAKFDHKEHLEKDWEKKFFSRLKEEEVIKKKGK